MKTFHDGLLLWLLVFIGMTGGSLHAEPAALFLHSQPEDQAPVVGTVTVDGSVEVLRIEEGWAEVRQGPIQAWMRVDDLWKMMDQQAANSPFDSNLDVDNFEYQNGAIGTDAFHGLVDFWIGNHELTRKMSDPFYRHRVVKISSEWGPLFYDKTRQYYVKGVYLTRFLDNRVRIALAKRRLSYRQIFGAMWSDNFMEVAVKANRGWLSNRQIFGKGQEFFVELSYHWGRRD